MRIRGTSRGRGRTYVFYLNYNQAGKRFEMMSMWGNVPHKALYFGSVGDGGRTIRLRSAAPSRNDDGSMVNSWAVIRYDGSRSYEWSSGSAPEGAADQEEVRFRDVATRKSG